MVVIDSPNHSRFTIAISPGAKPLLCLVIGFAGPMRPMQSER
jgi:hypothetical protein